ncbi:MAG: hypothetical protein K0Q73_8482 [Paenibacillus sp.]|nr:hypothetical protein [Paenibacillus sp.]
MDLAKAKIFISSVNEDGLKPLRKQAFRDLMSLGHEPQMWEENLGPWPANVNPVVKCLEAVEQSDLYLLFIGSSAGTYYPEAKRTVTHLEFIKAFDKGKMILVFADVRVKSKFFSVVKRLIDEIIEHYQAETRSYPSPEKVMMAIQGNDKVPKEIEPYVWYLLYDMTIRNVYVDDLSLGVPVHWNDYFSDLLRRGSMLLPLQSSIIENNTRLEQYDEAFSALSEMIPQVHISGLRSKEHFLKAIMSRMSGGTIEHHYGPFMSETVGNFGACCGATLYIQDGEKLKFVAKTGTAAGVAQFSIHDQSSYVVLTFKLKTDVVHYTESKQMFYCSMISGPYILTLHFPSSAAGWSNQKYVLYQESVNDAILNKNPYLVELIKIVLGGMQA